MGSTTEFPLVTAAEDSLSGAFGGWRQGEFRGQRPELREQSSEDGRGQFLVSYFQHSGLSLQRQRPVRGGRHQAEPVPGLQVQQVPRGQHEERG